MNELSADYIKAKELDRRIKTSAQLAQQSLYDMCMGFKEMRDSRLYKELGYSDFGDYCEKETGMKRSNVYNYIVVVEKLPTDFVQSIGQRVGMTKLQLLTTLNNEQREEITENTDLESTTVKELKAEIKLYQEQECKNSKENQQLRADRVIAMNRADDAERECNDLKAKIQSLENEIRDLENRPIDVAVVDHGDETRLLKETIKSLERENIKQNEALSEQYQKDVQEVRESLENEKRQALEQAEKDKQEKLAELRNQLEQTKKQLTVTDDKETFKAYLSTAADSIKRLCTFVKAHADSDNHSMFVDKARQLSNIINSELVGYNDETL